eukprot:TRINITY_DN1068_c0_g1_i2.p1 TRINITY_DN1068_c0_g1~~TRINITY_DN1068_c0_g1_i2.p1  ORF type:complete len:668 (+),score=238.88 TRINITY_DN1068_c0_g1_i2:120-2123(+)
MDVDERPMKRKRDPASPSVGRPAAVRRSSGSSPHVETFGDGYPDVVTPVYTRKGGPKTAAAPDEEEEEVIVICPGCSHKQPKDWEGFDPVARMVCQKCGKDQEGWTKEEVDDQETPWEELHPALQCWAKCGWRDFAIDWEHTKKEIPLAKPVKEIRGIKAARLLAILDKTKIPEEEMQLWLNHDGSRLFHHKGQIRESLSTICEFIDSGVCKSDAGDRLRCIVLMMEEKPGAYDVGKLLLTMAQNGNLCHVQKEIGIRAVYNGMTGSGKDDADASSAETILLSGLQALREVLAERQATKVCERRECGIPDCWRQHLTHYIMPVRNAYHDLAGLPYIPDQRRIDGGASEFQNVTGVTPEIKRRWFEEFAATYTTWQIHWMTDEAVTGKKVSYESAQQWFQQHSPRGVDSYEFRAEFAYNMTTGKVTKKALYYMLWVMKVLRGVPGSAEVCDREGEGRLEVLAEYDAMWGLWRRTVEMESEVRWKLSKEYDEACEELRTTETYRKMKAIKDKQEQAARIARQSGGKAEKAATARLTNEKRAMKLPPGVTLENTDATHMHWKGKLLGPADSPYEGGTFEFRVEATGGYPADAPEFIFDTPIHHPQVDQRGKMKMPILAAWEKKRKLIDVVKAALEHLSEPVFDRSEVSGDASAEQAWRAEAKKMTDAHAV